MSDLKPCPFCGGEAEAVHEINGFWTVECVKCGALVDGIEAWNSRAERTCEMEPTFINPHALQNVQEFACTACGRFVIVEQLGDDEDRPNYCPNCGCKVVGE